MADNWRTAVPLLNLGYGLAMASIGLTIPAIALASIWLEGPLVLTALVSSLTLLQPLSAPPGRK